MESGNLRVTEGFCWFLVAGLIGVGLLLIRVGGHGVVVGFQFPPCCRGGQDEVEFIGSELVMSQLHIPNAFGQSAWQGLIILGTKRVMVLSSWLL